MRVLSRDHDEVDDGWLCDKGRFAYQHVHTDERLVQPLVREGTNLQPASWEKALAAASGALKKAGAKTAALAGGETTNEEAFLLARLLRDGLGSGHLSARPEGELPLDVARALADPALQATVLGPRVRARGAADRRRPDRRRAGLGPAHPQGRAPQRRPRRRRLRAPDRARHARRGHAAPRARHRRGAARRARRRAERRRGQPRRRGQHGRLERRRGARSWRSSSRARRTS